MAQSESRIEYLDHSVVSFVLPLQRVHVGVEIVELEGAGVLDWTGLHFCFKNLDYKDKQIVWTCSIII